jgi:hypothetical protein
MADDPCSTEEMMTLLQGYARTLTGEATTEEEYHQDPYHWDKSGALGIAQQTAAADGHNIPWEWKDTAEKNNPVMDWLLNKGGAGREANHFITAWDTPEKSVAKPVFNWADQKKDAFDPTEMDSSVYKEDVSDQAQKIRTEIRDARDYGKELPYGVTEQNFFPTDEFLGHIVDGYPFFDFGKPSQENLISRYASKGATNTARGHMLLNVMTPIYHGLSTIPRSLVEYPIGTVKALARIVREDPMTLLGKPAEDLDQKGIYSKSNPGSLTDWSRYEWSRGLTFIPQCQTMAETLAYRIHEATGAPLDQVMARVAMRPDPFRIPLMFVGKESQLTGYGRYALMMDGWYLNLLKRATQLHTEDGWKALAALGTYSLMKTMVFGSKSAVPGILHGLLAYKEAEKKGTFNNFDKELHGNVVKGLTGLDLGESTADLNPWFSIAAIYDMLHKNYDATVKDTDKLMSDKASGSEKLGSGIDMALLLTQTTTGWIPQSGIKAERAYFKALKDASGDPAHVDVNDLLYQGVKQQFGKETADKWKKDRVLRGEVHN